MDEDQPQEWRQTYLSTSLFRSLRVMRITCGSRVFRDVLIGMISCGMTGRILFPPAFSISSTPCITAICSFRASVRALEGYFPYRVKVAYLDGKEAVWVFLFTDAIEEDWKVVMVVKLVYLNLIKHAIIDVDPISLGTMIVRMVLTMMYGRKSLLTPSS